MKSCIVRHPVVECESQLSAIAKEWFRKYKGEYGRINLFTVEDLTQEIQLELLEGNLKEKSKILAQANRIANKLRMRGGRKPVEIPISQLDKKERDMANNLFYGNYAEEDDYSEESFP